MLVPLGLFFRLWLVGLAVGGRDLCPPPVCVDVYHVVLAVLAVRPFLSVVAIGVVGLIHFY